MPRRRQQKVNEIIAAANRNQPEERTALLDEVCVENESLGNKIEELLASENKTNLFIEPPAPYFTPEINFESDAFSPGQEIDSYKLIRKIGSGGMGAVYLARDPELKRDVALKILPEEFTGNQNRVDRFHQEAIAVSQLNHPNILTIHKVGQAKQTHYIVTEYVDGKTLREVITAGITLSETLDVIIQTASALKAAHEAGIIHRDIKPENIMVRRDGYVKVLDFGLAKLVENNSLNSSDSTSFQTQPGILLGTPAYMSPEQIDGKAIDYRTDLFSLGSLLYECLTGKRGFQGETLVETISNIISLDPPPPSKLNPQIPRELDAVALKLLQKKPEKRYQSAADLIEELCEINVKLQQINQTDTTPLRIKPKTIGLKPLSTLSRFVEKPRSTVVWSIGLISILFLGYFLFASKPAVTVPVEAVKLFNGGTEAIRDGAYFRASKLLEEAVKSDNNFILAHARLAEAWMELDYVGRAQNELLKVRNLQQSEKSILPAFSQSEDSLYIDAINATVLRDFSKASEAYEAIALRLPDKAYVYLDLGRTYEKREEIDKAIESYEKAAGLDGQYGAAFLRLGILRSRKAEFEKAHEAFDKAESIYDRQSNDEGVADVKFQRGVSFNNQEKLAAARNQFEQVLTMPRANNYQQIRSMLQISSVCYSGGDTVCAESFALKAITIAKAERMENLATNGLINLGNVFLAGREYDKAEQQLQQAIEFARKDQGLRNEASALLALGSLRIQQKKPEEAEILVKQALPFFQKGGYNKEISQANLMLGRAAEMKGDYAGALKALEEVENSTIASSAERAYAKMASGNILMNQEKYPEALRRFEQSYDLYQSLETPFYVSYTLFYLSDALYHLGRFEEARDRLFKTQTILKEGHSLLPTVQTQIHLLNAQIALSKRNFSEAIKEVQQANFSKDSSVEFEANRILGLAQTGLKLGSSEGVQHCLNALRYAENTKDLRKINLAKLASAEAHLNAGNYREALEAALQAKDYFVNAGHLESGWRAWLIAAQASRQLNEQEKTVEYAAKALETLSNLQSNWGQEQFQIYLAKPDINLYFKQAESLAKHL
jgi:serine/threonine protein kinase